MKIEINNLGALKQAEFSLGSMTIISGENNTGKTYATYALFGFLSWWKESFFIQIKKKELDELYSEGVVHVDLESYSARSKSILNKACKEFEEHLSLVFAAPAGRFLETKFQVSIKPKEIEFLKKFERRISSANAERLSLTKDEGSTELIVTLLVEKDRLKLPRDVISQIIGNALKEVIFTTVFSDPFIASAERTGAAIFRKELNLTRNRLLEDMIQTSKDIDRMELFFKVYQDYPLPVKNNVEFTRALDSVAKKSSYITKNHPDILSDFADIIGGEYVITGNDEPHFVPKRTRIKLPMVESSSSVRSLLNIGFYLRHVVKPGDLLMIDEPELNLHPENQRRMARLFARLVNLGVKIFLTTHSDYIIKELNILIMLNHDKPHLKKIAKTEGYQAEELISPNKIKVYIAKRESIKLEGNTRKSKILTLVPADIDPELGIEVSSFDSTIEAMNRIQEEIIWGEE